MKMKELIYMLEEVKDFYLKNWMMMMMMMMNLC